MHIEKPVLGQITQGTIFTAVTAENYSGAPVWGLCITARCDVAHENKARVFNYLPIVRYEDWLLEDGARMVIERISAEVFGKAKEFLTQRGKSVSVLDSYPPAEVAQMLFPVGGTDKDSGKFHDIATRLVKLEEARDAIPLTRNNLAEISSLSKKTAEKIVKDLWSNQISGYYFLSHIGDTEHSSQKGYVVLLREVHHVSRSAALAIANGVSAESSTTEGSSSHMCDFSVFDFAYPTAKLKSPWIEHLMQQFSLLFARIGLPDPSPASLKNLVEEMSHV